MAARTNQSQRSRLVEFLRRRSLARAAEIREAGVDATTIARALADGVIVRLSRGLYQLPGSADDANQALAEAAKRTPKGVICMTSALAFHGLTDQMPRKVWIAIGPKDWKPSETGYPPLRVVRFTEPYLSMGIERHKIAGVDTRVYSATKTIADIFRNPKLVDRSIAVEAMRSALKDRIATPAEIAEAAREGRIWNKVRPYLEALTSDG
ncbi:transcriptional regulator [Marinicaulis flavus]|uniref:Transcriptional regulator n=1 Tax=Hyphococcus luteus TaxID=2058213 RepID=A0A2S7K8A8_9PROT|nr:transcriptional regulator [Marinicaulis flavus]